MYESKILKLKEMPVFTLSDVSQIVSGKEYAKKLLKKLTSSGELKRIKKNVYTFHDDPLLISTFLVKPSYISSVSALSYHKLITQMPKDVFCLTTKKEAKIKIKNLASEIYFIHTNYFFGFKEENYLGFKILIATPEKAIIDSIGNVPISVFEEAIENININTMEDYLLKTAKSSLTKRIGYLLEKNGFKLNKKIKNKINNKYLYLDPLAKKFGIKNKEWKIIVNTK